MELHGGTLSVKSEGLGHGSVFYIDTPLWNMVDIPCSSHTVRNSSVHASNGVSVRRFSFIRSPASSTIVPETTTIDVRHQYDPDTLFTASNSQTYTMTSKIPFDSSFENTESECMEVNGSTDHAEMKRNDTRLWSILVVDDAESNRKMLARLLKSRCRSYEEACDGLEAINIVMSAIERDQRFDVILMDYIMPNMDGPTATMHIRQLGYEGVIIGVTGNTIKKDIETFLNSGANWIMSKPFDICLFDSYMKGIQ